MIDHAGVQLRRELDASAIARGPADDTGNAFEGFRPDRYDLTRSQPAVLRFQQATGWRYVHHQDDQRQTALALELSALPGRLAVETSEYLVAHQQFHRRED